MPAALSMAPRKSAPRRAARASASARRRRSLRSRLFLELLYVTRQIDQQASSLLRNDLLQSLNRILGHFTGFADFLEGDQRNVELAHGPERSCQKTYALAQLA